MTATGRDRAGGPYARSLGPVCQRRVKTIHSAATRYLLLGVVPVERDPWWIVVRSAIPHGTMPHPHRDTSGRLHRMRCAEPGYSACSGDWIVFVITVATTRYPSES